MEKDCQDARRQKAENRRYRNRADMPVDGVLIGTAAMTAKEAHTSPEVKQMLVKTPEIGRAHV